IDLEGLHELGDDALPLLRGTGPGRAGLDLDVEADPSRAHLEDLFEGRHRLVDECSAPPGARVQATNLFEREIGDAGGAQLPAGKPRAPDRAAQIVIMEDDQTIVLRELDVDLRHMR